MHLSSGFQHPSVAPTRTTTEQVHRRVVNEVPNAATNEASEAAASRRRTVTVVVCLSENGRVGKGGRPMYTIPIYSNDNFLWE